MTAALRSTGLAAALFALAAQPPADKDKKPADTETALAAFRQGKLDDALKGLEAAARADPAMAPPRVVLARWLFEANQGPLAREALERAIAEDPTHPEPFITNALLALRERRFTEALLNCETILKLADSPRWDADRRKRFRKEGLMGLVAASEARADWAGVKGYATALLADDPKAAANRGTLARALFQLGQPDDALAELKTAAADDPLRDPPELSLAQLWAGKGDAGKAEEWYGKAAAGHPKSARVRLAFGGWLLDRGRVADAKGQAAAAKTLAPDSPETKGLLGLIARHEKDYPAARTLFEEMARDRPTNGFAVGNLALVLSESANPDDRRRGLENAENYARQNPQNADARAVLGYSLLKNGRTADAERELRLAVSAPLVTPDTAYYFARLQAEKAEFEAARDTLKKALASTGVFVYRADAAALLAEVEAKAPKKDEPKK